MVIMGIDIDSKKFGITLFEDETFLSSHFYESKEKDVQERIYELYCELDKILETLKPDKVYIEKTFRTSNVLSESIANFKLLCRLHSILIETVHNKVWKKKILGNGNCSKEDIKQFVLLHNEGLNGNKQDIYDSFCICLYGAIQEMGRRIDG